MTSRTGWRFSGNNYHEIGRRRVWVFAKVDKRVRVIEYEMVVEDCDGDFALWSISVVGMTREGKVEHKTPLGGGETRDLHSARNAVYVAMNRILGPDKWGNELFREEEMG